MRYFLLALLICLATTPLKAQQDAGTHIGVGVRLANVFVFNRGFLDGEFANGATLLVPININDRLRVEPEIGFSRSTSESDLYDATTSQYVLGIGIMPLIPRGNFTLYAGGRFRYVNASQDESSGPFGGDREISTSGISLAPIVGGEFFFARWFSLGGEAGFEYRTSSSEDSVVEEDSSDSSSFGTTGAVHVRFYFN